MGACLDSGQCMHIYRPGPVSCSIADLRSERAHARPLSHIPAPAKIHVTRLYKSVVNCQWREIQLEEIPCSKNGCRNAHVLQCMYNVEE